MMFKDNIFICSDHRDEERKLRGDNMMYCRTRSKGITDCWKGKQILPLPFNGSIASSDV